MGNVNEGARKGNSVPKMSANNKEINGNDTVDLVSSLDEIYCTRPEMNGEG